MVAYATAQQLAAWWTENVGGEPTASAARLLGAATRRIDEILRTAVYDVDTAGLPTDATIVQALADMTCEQVRWMAELGDTGSGAQELYSNLSIGSVNLTRAASGGDGSRMSTRHAPEAVSIAQQHGLLPGTVYH